MSVFYLEANKSIGSFSDLNSFLFNRDDCPVEAERAEDGFKPLQSDLDTLLSKAPKDRGSYHLLFVGNDGASMRLLSELKNYTGEIPVYVISSFELPEWFADFNVRVAPKLVSSYVKFFVSEDYLPSIYRTLFRK